MNSEASLQNLCIKTQPDQIKNFEEDKKKVNFQLLNKTTPKIPNLKLNKPKIDLKKEPVNLTTEVNMKPKSFRRNRNNEKSKTVHLMTGIDKKKIKKKSNTGIFY